MAAARRLAVRLRPPRRLRFTATGLLFTVGTLAVGLAAVNTGNNLLYLLLGAMLGFIAVSGWLSEQMLRRIRLTRRLPNSVTAERPARIRYQVENHKRRLPSFDLVVGERGREPKTYLALVPGRGAVTAVLEETFPRRGIHLLSEIVVETSFPFGFFRKARSLVVPGRVVVWPRHDLRVREPRRAGERADRGGATQARQAAVRGDYRALREYRPGDDPRDVHWRSSARLGAPVVREYDREDADTLWICLDPRHPEAERGERAVEVAASLVAAAVRRGERFALSVPERSLPPASGAAALTRALDVLAEVRVGRGARAPVAAEDPRTSILVSAGESAGGWADVLGPEDASETRTDEPRPLRPRGYT